MRQELADIGRPAAQQHGDPEVHQLLLGQRRSSRDSEALLLYSGVQHFHEIFGGFVVVRVLFLLHPIVQNLLFPSCVQR